MLTACVALAAVVALVVQLVDDEKRSAAATPHVDRRPVAATPTSIPAFVSWVRANVPASAPVVTDPAAAELLRTAGQRGATSATDDLTACSAGTLILLTPAASRLARQDQALQNCIHSSYAIAAWHATQLRAVPDDVATARRARAAALADRERGGAALASNPSLAMSADVRAALLDGRLDLRGESVLSELAAQVPLRLTAIDGVPAETGVGMPARTVEIRVPNFAAVTALLEQVAAPYRPEQVVHATPHVLRLTWPFRTEPPPVLD